MACTEDKKTTDTVAVTETTVNEHKGLINLTIDEKIYEYDNISWKKSSIKKEKDLNARILQKGLPNVQFKIPDIENSLGNEQKLFVIPSSNKGLKQMELKFFDESRDVENKLNKHIVFRKGELKASLKDNVLIINFKGLGGPMLDRQTTYPISGTITINI